MDDVRLEAIRRLAEPILQAASAELVELATHQHGGQVTLRFLVDKVGGVTIADCSRINQRLGQVLEEANVLEERYTLEVSSPGLDRPLTSVRDYERAIGEELTLELTEPIGKSNQMEGSLLSVQWEDAIVLTTQAGNVTVPFTQIRRAKKKLKW